MKRWIGNILWGLWALGFIGCMFGVFFVSWAWTFAMALYVGASILVLNFIAPPQQRGTSESQAEDDAPRV
jgi:hypothetical protein